MKKAFWIGIIILLMSACSTKTPQNRPAEAKPSELKASIEFMNGRTYDFGVYGRREPVSCDFVFRNNGSIPLVIDHVDVSCGCTKVDYPKHPIDTGAIDTINVTYDGNGFKSGYFFKNCYIYSNADSVYILRIQGTYSKTLEEEWLKEHPEKKN